MNKIRENSDVLETLLPAKLWPLPTYHEMLFHQVLILPPAIFETSRLVWRSHIFLLRCAGLSKHYGSVPLCRPLLSCPSPLAFPFPPYIFFLLLT
jgi:hypothetical protein